MTAWMIRAGRKGENEDAFIKESITAVGLGLKRSITEFASREDLRDCLTRPQADQLWRFANEMQVKDLVVLPRKRTREVAVGRITGDYHYRPDLVGDQVPHTRAVEWMVTDVPRSNFDQDLLNSLGALMTISQPGASNAEVRIERVAKTWLGSASDEQGGPSMMVDEVIGIDPNEEVDIDQAIKDGIVKRLQQKSAGTRLEHLVASILRASGYYVLETREGPDGGVDVVAGKGDLGFDIPLVNRKVLKEVGA